MKRLLILLLVLAMMLVAGCDNEPPPKICEARYSVRWDTGGYRSETGGFNACTVDVDKNGIVRATNEYGKERIIIADSGVLTIMER